MAIYNEHGIEKVHFQMLTNVDPNMENYEALAYQLQAGASFLCIWEALDASEFILTSNGLGLWEGVAVSDHVHHVFVASPRIAVVLRANITPMFEKMKCRTYFGGDVYEAVRGSVTLESSLLEEVSSDVLEQVDKEVVLVVFLDWVIDKSAHVLDKIPGVTILAMRIQIL
ncbi:hypothetical protein EDD85DRAFT_1019723 [Armillaria nabsnona]|nr:hypothetical protein EDD85DRAFT_1019723 [Armillaria nabsnona]